MPVSREDVRRVAELARLGLGDERLAALAVELNGILAHMEVLGAALRDAAPMEPPLAPTPLREDVGPSVPLARPPEAFAPDFRDGFFVVPRLASHEDPAA